MESRQSIKNQYQYQFNVSILCVSSSYTVEKGGMESTFKTCPISVLPIPKVSSPILSTFMDLTPISHFLAKTEKSSSSFKGFLARMMTVFKFNRLMNGRFLVKGIEPL